MKNILSKTILLLFILSTETFAKEWEVTEFKNFVTLEYPGKITYGDKLSFNFSKKNCNRVNYFFSAYSAVKNKNFMNLQGRNIPLNINGVKTEAKTIYTTPFLMGYRGMFFLGTYDSYTIAKFFDRITNYEIKIDNRNGFVAKDFFDIDVNQWNLNDSKEAFDFAKNKCKEKSS